MVSQADSGGAKGHNGAMSEIRFDPGETFPEATRAAWQALARDTLARVGETLSPDGVPVRALYTRADGAGAAVTKVSGRMIVRSRIACPEPAEANRQIREELAGGAGSILVVLDGAARSGDFAIPTGLGGVAIRETADVEAILSGISDAGDIAFEAGASAVALAQMMDAVHGRARKGLEAIHANLGHDGFAVLARFGRHPGVLDAALAEAAGLAAHLAGHVPNIRVADIDAVPYHAAGASPAQEIAIALAAGVAYLRAFTQAGMPLAEAARAIAFTLTTDADFLVSIAKLRAFRRAWARVLEASGDVGATKSVHLAVTTSPRMMTRQDPHTNLLRTTVAAAAAILGGADALTVLPFTERLGPSALARRLARNTPLILVEEADLDRVTDSAGGSFALEALTEALAAEAWGLFQEIEREGGIGASLQAGRLQARIAAAYEKRRARIAEGQIPILGVSHYVNAQPAPIALDPVTPAKTRALGDQLKEVAARTPIQAAKLEPQFDEAAVAPAREAAR